MANLKDLGEFGLIDRLSEKFKHQARDTVFLWVMIVLFILRAHPNIN
ncbi:MAG: hypothetical protein Ct9H300mP23_06870 [Nitrospinota bacterium]|nr:MAG: hypothetical protein Ct9H300mP23_06870 [Nitrospinota bacterium]